MKKIILITLFFFLYSCFNEQKIDENDNKEYKEEISNNQESKSVEEEFSKDLDDLLKLIDEDTNE